MGGRVSDAEIFEFPPRERRSVRTRLGVTALFRAGEVVRFGVNRAAPCLLWNPGWAEIGFTKYAINLRTSGLGLHFFLSDSDEPGGVRRIVVPWHAIRWYHAA